MSVSSDDILFDRKMTNYMKRLIYFRLSVEV